MEKMKRIVSLLLCAVMVIGFLPVSVFAAGSDAALTASLNEAKEYIHSITLNNASNDPEKVVKNFGTHFTWDNEKRESSKTYLYDWSYYNGVVFEGIEYLYEVTEDDRYKNYVMEYMSSLIDSDGNWAKCTNNSSKECAGYNANHGADCYKTASLLLDAYEMSGDSRYLTMAKTLNTDLNTAASKYSLSACGNNFNHTWPNAQTQPLWLDGLYMILPFRAEYAKYTGNTAELNLIVDRLQWVSDNMYNSSRKLFYHAATNSSTNSGTYWLRSIGWYAAAIVDVMDSMEGDNLETMKVQLKKLVDGMKDCQNASNGMWLNNMKADQSSSNPYETSGTALVCYAVMKAVNNGWLDKSYADMAILAFNGICDEKLSNNKLTDICFKGAPGSSNSEFKDNEGKGLGPFIMLYAEVLEYVNKPEEPEETVPETSTPTEPTVPETSAPVETEPVVLEYMIHEQTGVRVDYHGITGLTVNVVEPELIVDRVSGVLTGTLVAYDIFVDDFSSGTADVTIAIPDGVDADNFAVFYLPDLPEEGEPEKMPGSASADGKTYTFTTTHFSTYVGGELVTAAEEPEEPAAPVTGTGNLPGGTRVWYELVNTLTSGKQYLIVSRNTAGDGTALGTDTTGKAVTVVTGNIINDKGNAAEWTATASGSSWNFYNGSGYLGYTRSGNRYNYSYELNPNGSNTTWTVSGNVVSISLVTRDNYIGSDTYTTYYLKSGNTWSMATSSANVYFYEQKTEDLPGTPVEFSVTPGALNMMVDDAAATLVPTITLGEGTVDSSNITWTSGNNNVVTVSNGVVTPVAVGNTTITATLNTVNGTALVDPISVTINVEVRDITLDSHEWTVGQNYNATIGHKASFSDVSLTLNYSEGAPVIVSAKDINFSYTDEVGTQTVTASYVDPVTGETLTESFPIQVLDKVVASGIFSGTKEFEFVQDSAANFTGLRYSVVYACGCEELIPYTALSVSGYDIKTPGVYENCPVTYNGQEIGTVKVTVTERTSITGSGELQSGKIYTLNTVAPVANEKYLIVNVSNGSGVALTNNNGSYTSTTVYSDNGTILLSDDSTVAWTYGSGGTYKNGRYYISPGRDDLSLTTSSTSVTTESAGSDRWYIYNTTTTIGVTRYRYVSYNSGAWGGSTLSSGSRGTTYL